MNQKLLSELKNSTKKNGVQTDSEKLTEGKPYWIKGRPASSTADTVCLSTQNGQMVFRDKDVLAIEKGGEDYFIKVKKGSNFIFKLEIIGEVESSEKCNCESNFSSVAKDSDPHKPDAGHECHIECKIDIVPVYGWHDKNGDWQVFYIPIIDYCECKPI